MLLAPLASIASPAQNVSTLMNILCSQPIVVESDTMPQPACSMRAFATLLDAT